MYGTIVAAMAARCEDPTPATAKLLYGTAYQCAVPACRRTLYRIDDETGEWELNSRIAHICAQSEGGPRWDPDMPCEQNRAQGNLLLLCLPHHTEVDDRHREFTVEVLRQWKAEQQRVAQDEGRSWPITDQQAIEAIALSSSAPVNTELVRATAQAARSRSRLVDTAGRTRALPAAAVRDWELAQRRLAANMPPAWDAATGELLPGTIQLSPMESEQHATRVRAALAQAVGEVSPEVVRFRAELAAIEAMGGPDVRPFTVPAARAAGELLAACGRWPPAFTDDDVLTQTISRLDECLDRLAARARGELVVPIEPPVAADPAPQDEVPTEGEAWFLAHRALLDQARPWSRVATRAFDPNLHALLIADTNESFKLPDVPSLLGYGFRDSSAAAADVARNADEETLRQVVTAYTQAQPVAAAIQLLLNLRHMARESDRGWLVATLDEALADSCAGIEVSLTTPEFWAANDPHVRVIMNIWRELTTTETVVAAVDAALAAEPTLLCSIVIAGSDWVNSLDPADATIRRRYSHIAGPPWWLPRQRVLDAIAEHVPGDDREPECRTLSAQLLELLTS